MTHCSIPIGGRCSCSSPCPRTCSTSLRSRSRRKRLRRSCRLPSSTPGSQSRSSTLAPRPSKHLAYKREIESGAVEASCTGAWHGGAIYGHFARKVTLAAIETPCPRYTKEQQRAGSGKRGVKLARAGSLHVLVGSRRMASRARRVRGPGCIASSDDDKKSESSTCCFWGYSRRDSMGA